MKTHPTSADEKPYLCWFDCETGGLNEETDPLLEIAFGFASWHSPFTILGWHRLAIQNMAITMRIQRGIKCMDEGVLQKHTESGLMAEVEASVYDVGKAEQYFMTALDSLPLDRKVMLAGNSIHFDRRFIQMNMPMVHKRLWHRMLDVSAISSFMQMLGLPKCPRPDEAAHRALDDIKQCVDQARFYAEHVKRFQQDREELSELRQVLVSRL